MGKGIQGSDRYMPNMDVTKYEKFIKKDVAHTEGKTYLGKVFKNLTENLHKTLLQIKDYFSRVTSPGEKAKWINNNKILEKVNKKIEKLETSISYGQITEKDKNFASQGLKEMTQICNLLKGASSENEDKLTEMLEYIERLGKRINPQVQHKEISLDKKEIKLDEGSKLGTKIRPFNEESSERKKDLSTTKITKLNIQENNKDFKTVELPVDKTIPISKQKTSKKEIREQKTSKNERTVYQEGEKSRRNEKIKNKRVEKTHETILQKTEKSFVEKKEKVTNAITNLLNTIEKYSENKNKDNRGNWLGGPKLTEINNFKKNGISGDTREKVVDHALNVINQIEEGLVHQKQATKKGEQLTFVNSNEIGEAFDNVIKAYGELENIPRMREKAEKQMVEEKPIDVSPVKTEIKKELPLDKSLQNTFKKIGTFVLEDKKNLLHLMKNKQNLMKEEKFSKTEFSEMEVLLKKDLSKMGVKEMTKTVEDVSKLIFKVYDFTFDEIPEEITSLINGIADSVERYQKQTKQLSKSLHDVFDSLKDNKVFRNSLGQTLGSISSDNRAFNKYLNNSLDVTLPKAELIKKAGEMLAFIEDRLIQSGIANAPYESREFEIITDEDVLLVDAYHTAREAFNEISEM